MIPSFDEHGYLPPGIHPATLEEVIDRFGTSSAIRQTQCESPVWLVEAATTTDIRRVVINGSFVTDVVEPNDVDCLLLVGDNFKMDGEAEQRLLAAFPFLDVQLVDAKEFPEFVDFFAADREDIVKGIVELIR